MILIPFYEIFPEVAEKETHSLHVLQDGDDSETPPVG